MPFIVVCNIRARCGRPKRLDFFFNVVYSCWHDDTARNSSVLSWNKSLDAVIWVHSPVPKASSICLAVRSAQFTRSPHIQHGPLNAIANFFHTQALVDGARISDTVVLALFVWAKCVYESLNIYLGMAKNTEYTGWAKKTWPFLKVCNSCILWRGN